MAFPLSFVVLKAAAEVLQFSCPIFLKKINEVILLLPTPFLMFFFFSDEKRTSKGFSDIPHNLGGLEEGEECECLNKVHMDEILKIKINY